MRANTKRFIRLLITLLIAAGVIPFFYPWHDPLLSWREVKLPQLPELEAPDLPAISTGDDTVTVYRWQDSSGGWHFGNEPPAGGSEYQRLQIDPNTNVVQAVPQPAGEKSEQASEQSANQAPPTEKLGYSAEDILQLVGQAKGARDAMAQRMEQQQSEIEQGR